MNSKISVYSISEYKLYQWYALRQYSMIMTILNQSIFNVSHYEILSDSKTKWKLVISWLDSQFSFSFWMNRNFSLFKNNIINISFTIFLQFFLVIRNFSGTNITNNIVIDMNTFTILLLYLNEPEFRPRQKMEICRRYDCIRNFPFVFERTGIPAFANAKWKL